MRPKRDRGAVLIFCVVLMASVGTILMSTADMGRFVIKQQYSLEDEAKWQYTEDGVKAIFSQQVIDKSLVLPSSTSVVINGFTATVDAAAGTGSNARMVALTTSISGSRFSRTRTTYVGSRGQISPMWFGYSTGAGTVLTNDITCDGDVYNTGDISGSGIFDVGGDLYSAQSSFTTSPTVAGTTNLLSPAISPTINIGNYQSAATVSLSGTQNVTLLLFFAVGAYQTLWYNNGDVTFDVTYSGKGTCVVNGNAVIKKLDRNSASDQALILVNGNLDIQTGSVQGFIFCTGNVTYSGAGNLQLDGALFCNNLDMAGKKLTVSFNSFFWDDPRWDKRMRVPGMW